MSDKFAPTPAHGAAYAVAIERVGGVQAIANCSDLGAYGEMRAKLDAILEWSKSQDAKVQAVYRWGVERVDSDLKSRVEIHENHRRVKYAMETLPKPPE